MDSINASPDVTIKLYKKKSQLSQILKRLSRNKGAIAGLAIVIFLVFLAVFADVLFDYKEVAISQDIANRLQPPSLAHPFGTDELGREVLARIVHGSRISLSVGFAATFFSLLIGGFLGVVSGYFGKAPEQIIMRVMDVLLAIPGLLLAIAIVAALGSDLKNLVIALTVSAVPAFARIARGAVLSVRGNEFIEAARAIGAKNSTIILEHIIPNSMAPVIVQATLNVAMAIMLTAGLSFLGLGVPAPTPEWGAMLSSGRDFIREYSYLTFFPGLSIMISVLAFNLLGDGLRDALDPRLK